LRAGSLVPRKRKNTGADAISLQHHALALKPPHGRSGAWPAGREPAAAPVIGVPFVPDFWVYNSG